MAVIATRKIRFRRRTQVPFPWSALPKFQIGQLVCWDYTVDDDFDERHGQTYRDYGFVTGFSYQPEHYKQGVGWVYSIKLLKSNAWPGCDYKRTECLEQELIPVCFYWEVVRNAK